MVFYCDIKYDIGRGWFVIVVLISVIFGLVANQVFELSFDEKWQ